MFDANSSKFLEIKIAQYNSKSTNTLSKNYNRRSGPVNKQKPIPHFPLTQYTRPQQKYNTKCKAGMGPDEADTNVFWAT